MPRGGQCSHSIHKGMSPLSHLSFPNCIVVEVDINYEALNGSHIETVIKEIALVPGGVIRTLHFQAPYYMRPHVSAENGLNWDDGHIPYHQLQTTVAKAVAGYTHLYSYGIEKYRDLSHPISPPVLNLEDFRCPSSHDLLLSPYGCGLSCNKFSTVRCATKNAYSRYEWLLYHIKTKCYV